MNSWRRRRNYKKKIRDYTNKWYQKNKKQQDEKNRERYRKIKKEITIFLGSKCNRCGFTDKRVLQVYHINGGGRRHFRIKGRAYYMYIEILESLKKGEKNYQLLCANCNFIEAIEKGYKTTIWNENHSASSLRRD